MRGYQEMANFRGFGEEVVRGNKPFVVYSLSYQVALCLAQRERTRLLAIDIREAILERQLCRHEDAS